MKLILKIFITLGILLVGAYISWIIRINLRLPDLIDLPLIGVVSTTLAFCTYRFLAKFEQSRSSLLKKCFIYGAFILLIAVAYLFFGCRKDITTELERALYPNDSTTRSCGYHLWVAGFK